MADDATGALEAGALLAARGSRVAVRLSPDQPLPAGHCPYDAIIVDTETRHGTAGSASSIIHRVAAEARGAGVRWIYKKTDSTLRGPIAAELGTLAAAFPELPLIYVPAYPAVGRTVREGRLYVNGILLEQTEFAQDPRWAVRTSSVLEVVEAQRERPVRLAKGTTNLGAALADPAKPVIVCDGSTDLDLRDIRDVLREQTASFLTAGPAGFIPHWADLASVTGHSAPYRFPKAESWLVVCGSLHPMSRKQAELAQRAGHPAILSPGIRSLEPETVAANIAAQVVMHLERSPVRGIIVFGGDTASAVWKAMGIDELEPFGEVITGVPVSTPSGSPGGPVFVTKAGGFGEETIVDMIVERMRR